MYPWAEINPETDSSLRLIHECAIRGYKVVLATPNNLTMRDTVASVFCSILVNDGEVSSNISTFYKKASFKKANLPLAGFDVIFMRSEPPLNTIALNFLDSVREQAFIINDIDGLRVANNKLYTSSFDDPENKFIPITHVSKTTEYLEKVFKESEADKMIMKPLVGYGGQGIILIEKKAQQNFRSLLDFYISNSKDGSYVILQEYIEGADEGDIRILMLNGEPIGAMRRVPAADDIRSNVHAGGEVKKHTLTKTEKALCKHIGPKLVRDGLFFVGIDVIGGKLIEVNVLSPGGIVNINRLNRTKLQKQVIDFVESVVNAKEAIATRKSEFRKIIADAHSI